MSAHEQLVEDDLGQMGAWTVALDAGRRAPREALRAPELRAALDLRHHLDCRGEPPPLSQELTDEGWSAKQSRSTGDWFARPRGNTALREEPAPTLQKRSGAGRGPAAGCHVDIP